MDESGNHPCLVAKGPCGHYYYATVETDLAKMPKETAREIATIKRRPGHVVELKTVQFVRDGGLDWTKECKKGTCGSQPAPRKNEAVATQQMNLLGV